METDHLSYPSRSSSASASTSNNAAQHVLIFFVPGNPGLIGYYAPFLSWLRDLLDANASLEALTFHIHGQNLAGFTDTDHAPFTAERKPHNLEHQIQHILRAARGLRIAAPGSARHGGRYDHVLLIGHSVGAYIALEVSHRVRRDPGLAPELAAARAILLFPTIERIAASASGWKLDALRRAPLLGGHVHKVARGFLRLWPYRALHWFVSRALGFPPHAAEVTARWLKSRDGVWQSLHLGMDEMHVIGEDKWDKELWEIEHDAAEPRPPKFYFFFGRHDHWVADHYRDEFIRKRSAQAERTRLVVDESGLPHAFCIDHSEPVAEKVHIWITEMFADSSEDS